MEKNSSSKEFLKTWHQNLVATETSSHLNNEILKPRYILVKLTKKRLLVGRKTLAVINAVFFQELFLQLFKIRK